MGTVGANTYAFIGLERTGGIMVYDVTDPETPEFVGYWSNRDMAADPTSADYAGDLGPESLLFISAADSPVPGVPLLISGNEVSGTVTVYSVTAPLP